MSDIKENRPLHKFLADSGYKEYATHDALNRRAFQKSFAVYKGKSFVEVVEYNYDSSPEYSYVVLTRFELPDGKWCKVEFQTFGGSELVERLPLYEDQAREVFLLLKGVGHE